MASIQTTAGGMPVLILREGTKERKGREAQKNNINAAKLVAETVKTCLGPRGMDKMLVNTIGDTTITNDGATILKEMDIEHPAAKMMVEVAKSVDNEVGDGTTSSVVFAGALLEKAEDLINKHVHPSTINDGWTCLLIKSSAFSSKAPAKTTEDVVPSPTSLSTDLATSTIILAAGCSISISFRIVAPSFVIVVSPIVLTSILSMPRGPRQVFTVSATSLAVLILFFCASLPLLSLVPSRKINTGIPPDVV